MLNVSSKDLKPQVYIICGGRRTGTTLLAGILCSDERTNPLGQEAQLLTRLLESYQWGMDHFNDFGRSLFSTPSTYTTYYQESAANFIRTIATEMKHEGMLVLKNPELSRVLLSLVELLPEAKLLAIVRDPRDQVASEMETGARRCAMGIRDINYETRNVTTLSNQYLEYNQEIITLHKQQPTRIHITRYEDLVQNPKETLSTLRRVTDLNITFDPTRPWPRVSPLAGLDTPAPSSSKLYGAPIDPQSVGRYKRDLRRTEIRKVEKICNPFMDQFGYL